METNIAGEKVFYVDYTWPELDALDRAGTVLVLPSGAVEEHGAHLTLANDSTAAAEVALRAAREIPGVIVMPCLWYTPSLDTSNYMGTISIRPTNFVNYVCDILESLYRHGFRQLVVANVHGGAKTVLDVAIREFHHRMGNAERAYNDDFFIHLHNVYAVPADYLNTLVEGRESGHACELETSVDMYLFPERVQPEKAVEEYIPWEEGFEWYIGDMHAVNRNGVHGDATKASAEKGEKVVNALVSALADILRKLVEGHTWA
ncbi:MAG: creatininase family protein [Planctomycetes bacterium]|nr:creatininase family protein [Planctomycetota bacterium]